MGRSVSVPTNAIATVFLDVSEMQDEDGEFFWEFITEDLQNVIQGKYQSFSPDDTWVDREDCSILENGHGRIVISQYGNIMSVSLVPRSNFFGAPEENLSQGWCSQISSGFTQLIESSYGTKALHKQGTMSNGVSFYKRVS